MKIAAYCLFALAALATVVAINNVFGAGANRPAGAELLVGYAVGSFLVPIALVIVGVILFNKRKQPH